MTTAERKTSPKWSWSSAEMRSGATLSGSSQAAEPPLVKSGCFLMICLKLFLVISLIIIICVRFDISSLYNPGRYPEHLYFLIIHPASLIRNLQSFGQSQDFLKTSWNFRGRNQFLKWRAGHLFCKRGGGMGGSPGGAADTGLHLQSSLCIAHVLDSCARQTSIFGFFN